MIYLKLIFTLLIGIVIGIGFSSLFAGYAPNPVTQNKVSNIHPKILDKEQRATTKKFETQLDSLQLKSVVLTQDLHKSKLRVTDVKRQNKLLRMELQALVSSRNASTDPIDQNNDCDSLQNKALLLIASDNLKDSLQDIVSIKLEQQLRNKDSTIDLITNKHQQLQLSFDESIQSQQILYTQNRLHEKQFKRQKIKRKLKSAVTVIAAGLAGYYLLSN